MSAAVVATDLSAAFDTVDNDSLLQRLKTDCKIGGRWLDWFRSYLTDRRQCITIENTTSPPMLLKFGLPQGTKLGPPLYSGYTTPLPVPIIIKKGGCKCIC